MIGLKGLPATHGGVERHVEQLGTRLAAMGHSVTVYTRPTYSDPSVTSHLGMSLKSAPTWGTKHTDAIVHSAIASVDALGQGYDIIHYHSIGPCLTAPLTAPSRSRVIATIHGQDWRRAKWGKLASSMLRLGEHMALRVADGTICVSRSLTQEYRASGHDTVTYIPNGFSLVAGDDLEYLSSLSLEDGRYLLFVGRLVPEKGAHHLIEAWKAAGKPLPLVVAGDTSHTDDYVARLRSLDSDVVFTGYVYGARLAALFRHAGLFVLPSSLEGLPIVLLEALAYGSPVLSSDIPPCEEVLGAEGHFFRAEDSDDLARRLTELVPRLPQLRSEAQAKREELLREYDWDRVAQETEALYRSVLDPH